MAPGTPRLELTGATEIVSTLGAGRTEEPGVGQSFWEQGVPCSYSWSSFIQPQGCIPPREGIRGLLCTMGRCRLQTQVQSWDDAQGLNSEALAPHSTRSRGSVNTDSRTRQCGALLAQRRRVWITCRGPSGSRPALEAEDAHTAPGSKGPLWADHRQPGERNSAPPANFIPRIIDKLA